MHRRLLALSLLLALSACVRNPVTGKRQLALVSKDDEVALGQQAAKEIEQTVGLVEDPALQQYVSSVAMPMARTSERPELPWRFQVVDDPAPNAFALPGGPIYITRGLLAHLDSEAELAGVLGHEIGHVTARHSVTQLSQAQLAQLGLGLGAVLSSDIAKYGQVAAVGLQLLFLKHGRDDEHQADELGFRYMLKAGYDPREMANVFTTLGRIGEASGGGKLPTWLSTHPDPGDRAEQARARVAKAGRPLEGLKVGQAEYLRHLQDLPYGVNPRQGFFRDNLFLHPELRFQLQFPEGWKTSNQPQAVVALSPQEDAVVGLATVANVSPEQALQAFFEQQGVRRLQAPGEAPPAGSSYFEAQTEQGLLRGLTRFFTHQSATLQLVGYTSAERLPTHDAAIRASFASFRELTDPEALAAQPARLELVTLKESMTLEQFQARYPSTIPLEELALLNGVEPGATLAAGRQVKRVVGGVAP